MRRLFERVVRSLRLDPRSHRVLEETLSDWRHEDEEVAGGWRHSMNDLRSAWSVLRALVLVSWWKPNPMMQTASGGSMSPRDEMINVINGLSPDSTYEDILRELAAVRVAKGEPGLVGGGPRPGRRFDPAFWRRAVTIGALFLVVSVAAGAFQTYTTTPLYKAIAQVRVEPDPGGQVRAIAQAQQMMNVDPGAFMLAEQTVLQSRELKLRVVRRLGLARYTALSRYASNEARAIEELAANLDVQSETARMMFSISYIAADPHVAAEVANAVAEEYVAQNLERKRGNVSAQLTTLGDMLGKAGVELDGDRRLLIQQTHEAQVVDPAVAVERVVEARQQLNARTYEADARKTAAEELALLSVDAALNSPELASDVAPLRGQINRLQDQKRSLTLQRAGPEHPAMKSVDEQIATTRTDIAGVVAGRVDAARRAYAAAEAQRANAERLVKYQEQLAYENSRNSIPHQQLRERISANEKALQELLQQKSQLELLSRGLTNNISIADMAAVPQRPHTPVPLLNFGVWLSAGLVAALLTAFLMSRRLTPRDPVAA